ncbi:hypothetical protein [Thauera linaloolentis]|uniref:Formylmethanofuran dehydrogenase subunit E domain-containing protein n=1 Tax=Thauera linaloolentis (strain DSM 12138 / JCM 21573 / CCUG 41526 / CIP 105981 / IAM 15112 / NBRC 102519 / 47Lol) TaxID=1123367 RepID=N6YXA2_THAL4|nr:hypothetical protein [Thauera linaloolentis]ENO87032.1 hypothetical protein C666_11910 [Thauera linaloolentis 47Lol = DSM 12138]MCM8565794.1 hypothetical protein [Thauera linaloolentis]
MNFPEFFHRVPRIRVHDPLADFLGAAEGGVLEYGYEDAVKLAGHSCPTVASAYVLACRAMGLLYPDALPERGGVRVDFAEPLEQGVTGVIASVLTLITGATQQGGFKGIAGRFVRRGLQRFEAELPLALRLTRIDTGAFVDAASDLSLVPAAAEMSALMGRCLHGEADDEERRRFGQLWQQRVERILLDCWDDDAVFQFRASPTTG